MDLFDHLSQLDFLTRWLGLTIRGTRRRLLFLWVVLMWLDVTIAFVVAFVPTKPEFEPILVYTGDVGFQHVHYQRHHLTVLCFFIRLNTAINLTFYYWTNFSWLHRANAIYVQLADSSFTPLVEIIVYRCKILMTIGFALIMWNKNSNMIIGNIRFRPEIDKYYTSIQCAYVVLWAYINTSVIWYTFTHVYFFCRISVKLFDRINLETRNKLRLGNPRVIKGQFVRFSQLCLMVHSLNQHIRVNYVAYFICSLPNVANMYYNAIYSNTLTLYLRTTFTAYMFYMLFMLVAMSHVIGRIDFHARLVAQPLFERFVVQRKMRFRRPQVVQLLRFFHYVWDADIGLLILGEPINSSTIITIMTIFMTLVAFIIKNLDSWIRQNSLIKI